MSDIIQLLPDHIANQIAAGEVVQRPSSVVKELLENAVDAGANSIKMFIKNAGKTTIQVIDNGKGMSVTDARLCFERHATSKIKKAEDLFNLNTKGFRGEALASIAAISHVELKTKPENEELGTFIKIEGSKIISQDFVSTGKGTNISVKNLFFNIPARRNFLKSEAVETRHIINEFQRIVLAHPSINFMLYHNNNEVYNLKSNNLKKRIVEVFGAKTNEKLVPISEQTDIVNIKGFIGKPKFAKKRRFEQFFFVNDRYIKSSYLNHAVINAFDGLIEQGYYPLYFLYLTVSANSVDINIHPTKTEIKFDNEKALYAILRSTIKHSLGQYNVAPVLDFNRNSSLDTPYFLSKNKANLSVPKISVDPSFNPFEESKKKERNFSYKTNNNRESWNSLYTSTREEIKDKQGAIFDDNQQNSEQKIFQIQRKYLLSSIKSGVVLIDQSSAHQRILYEKFLETISVKALNSQQLLFPVKLSFSPKEIEMINSIKNELKNIGFSFDEITKDSLTIKGIPALFNESKISVIFEDLLNNLDLEIPNPNFNCTDVMAKSFAKTLSIKTGVELSGQEKEVLVNDLFSCKNPSISPFDKPTFKTINLKEIDKIFNR